MKKTVAISIAAVAVLNAASSDEISVMEGVSGEIRTAYVSQDNRIDTDTYGTSIGGILKYDSAAWNNLRFGIGAYISQKLNFLTGSMSDERSNPDLFGKETRPYAYIGEGYADYTNDGFSLRVGRQKIDIPFADTDDIRMHPNSFEAALATYRGVDETTFTGGYISRWAGYDSGDDISKFKKLAQDSNGAVVAGVSNDSIENLELDGWYFGVDNLSDIFYGNITYTADLSNTDNVELTGQWAQFNAKNNSLVEGNIYGIGVDVTMGMLTLGAEYNKASSPDGKHISSGFGNGPYVVDTEEVDLDDFEDVKAYQFNAQLDMEEYGTLSAGYTKFKSIPQRTEVDEIDLIAMYNITEAINAEVNYVIVNDKNNNSADDGISSYDGGYNRLMVRLKYSF